MKIGELGEHCGNCPLIDCCTSPYDTPELCCVEKIANMEVDDYQRIYDSVSDAEIREKIRYNKENDECQWSDETRGAICDIVIEKWKEERKNEAAK